MRIGVYPGSFDPLTIGHLDIIKRSIELTDTLIVAVAKNSAKKPLFTFEERKEIIDICCKDCKTVEVDSFEGLLVNYCREKKASIIIRGLRSTTDFDFEYSIAAANRSLGPDIETIFLMSKGEYACVSSQIVREIASYKGDVSSLVPPFVVNRLDQKYSSI